MFLGVDQSLTSPGFAVLPAQGNTPLYLEAVKTGARRDGERLAFIWSALQEILSKYPPQYAALEGYSMQSTNRSFDLGEVGGIVRLALYTAGVPFVVVAPKSLKKFVTGSGEADKAKMRAATLKKYGIDIPQNDMCDAYGLAHVARACYHQTSTVRAELEVVSLLLKPKEPNFLAPKVSL